MESARAARTEARLGPCALAAFAAALLALSLAGPAWAAAPPTGNAGASIATAPAGTVAGSVDAGGGHTCGVRTNGTVACWGRNDRHQLADGTADPSDRPKLVFGLIGAEQLAVSADGACARLKGGEVRCWGGNGEGELGDGSTVDHDVPMPIKAPALGAAP